MIAKVMQAIVYTKGDILVCFSGGKDSALLLDVYCEIASMFGYNTVYVGYADTTNETRNMRQYVKWFIKRCEEKYGVKIELYKVRPKGNLTFADIIKTEGIPFATKAIAGAVRKTKSSMEKNNIKYSDIVEFAKPEIRCRDVLREMGLSDSAVLSLTGWSNNRQDFGTHFKISKMWLPLLDCEIPITEKCCLILKENPLQRLDNPRIMTGEQANESQKRESVWLEHGCNYILPNNGYKSMPLGSLSKQAVLYAIYYRNIPLCEDYGKVVKCEGDCYKCTEAQRTGCALCGFGIKYDPERFIRLQKSEPAKVNWAFKPRNQGGAGYRELCEYSNEYCKTKIIIPN